MSIIAEHQLQPKDRTKPNTSTPPDTKSQQTTTDKNATTSDITPTDKDTSNSGPKQPPKTPSPKPAPQQPTSKPEPEPEPEDIEIKEKTTNDKWVKSMYRKLQKNIHPDRNTSVATEATKIHRAMETNDVTGALYSYYVYHNDCPIPDNEIDDVIENVRKEYIKYRQEFDNQPPDIILRSKEDEWDNLFDRCVVKQ